MIKGIPLLRKERPMGIAEDTKRETAPPPEKSPAAETPQKVAVTEDVGKGEELGLEVREEVEEEQVTEYTIESDEVFRIEMILPADAFTLFNVARAMGLEKNADITFDEWTWDCIKKRFELDYKMQLVLTPVVKVQWFR